MTHNFTSLSIRDGVITDLEAIVKIYNSTISSRMVTADTEEVSVKSRENWFYDHNQDFRPIWVVENEDKIIAWLSFQSFYGRPAYNATAEISIYIDENHRKLGLGKMLVEQAIQRSPELGIKTLLGFIFGHNEPSLILFKKAGFSVWGKLPNVAELDNNERDLLILGKRVN